MATARVAHRRPDEAALLGSVSPPPVPNPDDGGRPRPAPGGRVVPLRAVRTRSGSYRSAYAAATRTTVGSVARTTLRGLGEVMATLGVLVLLLVAYQLWGKAAAVAAEQDQLDQQLEQAWADPTPAANTGPDDEQVGPQPLAPPPGDALARMYIPTLGKHWVVVEGWEQQDIRYAPGHYPPSALPGQVGNFAVAGHRNPATFWDLDKVVDGDVIVVETRYTWYTYRVTRNHIVTPDAMEVVAPVPGDPDATPTKAMLTLVTCNPKWDNYQRMIVHAEVVDQQPRAAGRPQVLSYLDG